MCREEQWSYDVIKLNRTKMQTLTKLIIFISKICLLNQYFMKILFVSRRNIPRFLGMSVIFSFPSQYWLEGGSPVASRCRRRNNQWCVIHYKEASVWWERCETDVHAIEYKSRGHPFS